VRIGNSFSAERTTVMVDLERALRFAADLGSVSTVEEFTTFALSGLASLVPAELWGFNDLDPGSREMVAAIWPPDGARPEHFAAVGKVVWQHPVVELFQRTGKGPPTRLSDVWSRDRYRSSTLYLDAYRAMGVEHQVSFSIADGPTAATIGLAANRSDRDFEDAELELLEVLRPALRAAWQRVQATSALVRTIEALPGGDSEGLLLVDARSRVRAASGEVIARFRAAGVDVVVGATVPEPVLGWLQRGGGRAELVIGSVPHALHLAVLAGARDADRVVSVRRPPAAEIGHGLTARELEVLQVAASGMTNAEIASSLAISARTVQKHLERAFEKLGVANRTAAAAALGDVQRGPTERDLESSH
jgi:DNA-binding CsgD family transcriptional regulator